jgi:hypothetical protein
MGVIAHGRLGSATGRSPIPRAAILPAISLLVWDDAFRVIQVR